MPITVQTTRMTVYDENGNAHQIDGFSDKNAQDAKAEISTFASHYLDQMREEVVNNDDAANMIAENFATNKAYAAGAYVYHQDANENIKLYKFTSAHVAGVWNGNEVVEVKLGNDVMDLKNAVTDLDLKIETSLVAGTAVAGSKRFLLNVNNPIENSIHISRLYMVANSLDTSTDVKIELANKTSTGYTVYDSKTVTLSQTTTIGELVFVADLDKVAIGDTYIFITTSVTTKFRAASASGKKLVVSDDTTNTSFTVKEVSNYEISFILYYNITTKYVNSQIRKRFVTVDANGNGDYTSVLTAMTTEPENTVIYIKPGVYNQDMASCLQKRVILIGSDRNQCIIRDTDGRYGHHPLYVSCGYFENLTIEAPYVSGESNEIDGTTAGSYAVHVDADQDYAVGKQIEFRHCIMRSDFFPAIGMGLRKNMTAILDDCIMENGQVSGRGNYASDGTLGALYFHDSNGEQGNQYIIVKNCVMKSKLAYAMCPYQVMRETQENVVYCDFIGNVLYSDTGKYANTVWFRGDPFNETTGIFHLGIGYGNSISSLNNNT